MEESKQISNKTLTFEDFKNENGLTYWWASDLMTMLGYKDMKSFEKVLSRATKALISLNIPHYDNIIAEQREISGVLYQDFKLTRFACYIAVMNGNPKYPEVASAQSYFAEQTRKFELSIQNNNELDRILIREELIEGNKSLFSTAKYSGVEDYAKFTNAGYLGMYNMTAFKLEQKRNVSKGKLMDNMGRTELAANLFRVTQTEERIKNKKIKGQLNLEQTHHEVGREVREMVKKNVGKAPENLPQEKQLSEIKKELKKGHHEMLKEDKQKQ
jgi:DNA-damage-inducible protein D